ncbi:MAG: hypothetical protein U1F43_13525 [Myxococcota bacterium]
MSRRSRTRAAAPALAAALAGCTHTFIYAGDQPPRFARGQLIVERPGEDVERYDVERIIVGPKAGGQRLPSTEEMRLWGAGVGTPEVDVMRIDVSTSGAVWRDWVLPGFGFGASFMLVTLGGLGIVKPDGSRDMTLPLTLALALALGLEGALIGGGLGALGEGGTTALRIPGGAELRP